MYVSLYCRVLRASAVLCTSSWQPDGCPAGGEWVNGGSAIHSPMQPHHGVLSLRSFRPRLNTLYVSCTFPDRRRCAPSSLMTQIGPSSICTFVLQRPRSPMHIAASTGRRYESHHAFHHPLYLDHSALCDLPTRPLSHLRTAPSSRNRSRRAQRTSAWTFSAP